MSVEPLNSNIATGNNIRPRLNLSDVSPVSRDALKPLGSSGVLRSLADQLHNKSVKYAQALPSSPLPEPRLPPPPHVGKPSNHPANENRPPQTFTVKQPPPVPQFSGGVAVGLIAGLEMGARRGHEAILGRDLAKLGEAGVHLHPAQSLEYAILEEYTSNRGPSELRRLVTGMNAEEAADKARERLSTFGVRATPVILNSEDEPCYARVGVSAGLSPLTAQHVRDAQSAGFPGSLTLDRANAPERRKQALANTPIVKGMDRDEYPPATFAEGGKGASVRYIPPSDNRSAGAQLRNQRRTLPDGCMIDLLVVP